MYRILYVEILRVQRERATVPWTRRRRSADCAGPPTAVRAELAHLRAVTTLAEPALKAHKFGVYGWVRAAECTLCSSRCVIPGLAAGVTGRRWAVGGGPSSASRQARRVRGLTCFIGPIPPI
jgi:hypothetical protein